MTEKPRVTRTYGPIHFEDLDPHRFEDLIRELIYDFRDWQTLEATGRSGGDEGFDIRAYEKREVTSRPEDEEEEVPEGVPPVEGNLWMIQVKREKVIGPKRIAEIISDIDSKDPPYSYILAAAANFSKGSYDVFRDKLREKGVMEYYLWGKAEIEDMLHLPKNDRILFTFFGISLVSKRRSISTEIRSTIAVKNKLYRVLGEGTELYKEVLLRDLKDTKYPYKENYKDFFEKPRWKKYCAFGHHPLGILCHVHNYFSFINIEKKEWDYCPAYDLAQDNREDDELRTERLKMLSLVRETWQFFPRRNQGYMQVDGLIRYSDVAVVDDKGDVQNYYPHLFVDFKNKMGPFWRRREILAIGSKEIYIADDYKRIHVFPAKIEKQKVGKVHKKEKIVLNEASYEELEHFRIDTIFEESVKYSFLNQRDVISVISQNEKSEEILVQITFKAKERVSDYLERLPNSSQASSAVMLQLGRDFSLGKECYIYEFVRYYDQN